MFQTVLNKARNDKFILTLDIPKALKSKFDTGSHDFFKSDSIQFSIYGSPVPSVNVPAINVPFGGQIYKASSTARPEYNPLTLKFVVDNGYKNYWVLWNWLNLFNDSKKSITDLTRSIDYVSDFDKDPTLIHPMSEYTSRFYIFGLDEYNNKIISFEYTGSFPTSLAEISYSNQDPTEINCSVTFAFNQLNVNLIKNINEANC
jgi:hypothetical protein